MLLRVAIALIIQFCVAYRGKQDLQPQTWENHPGERAWEKQWSAAAPKLKVVKTEAKPLRYELRIGQSGQSSCADVNLSRQKAILGMEIEGGNQTFRDEKTGLVLPVPYKCRREFAGSELHREYVMQDSRAIYLKTSSMCGVDLFTQSKLECGSVSFAEVEPNLALLGDLLTVRAFGVELELVAHSKMSHSIDAKISSKAARRHSIYSGMPVSGEHLIPLVQSCFAMKVKTRGTQHCTTHEDCPLDGYCRQAHSTTFRRFNSPYCKARQKCSPEKSVDGVCPVASDTWTWMHDPSVTALSEVQAHEVGDMEESYGIPFELVSPILSGVAGLKSMVEVTTTLKHLGVQAGPSAGMHVHVNVGRPWKDEASPEMGSHFSAKQIFNVWAHYARFQLVINEMLQDSRIGNAYAHPLLVNRHSTVNTHPIEDEDSPWNGYVSYPPRERKVFGFVEDTWKYPSMTAREVTKVVREVYGKLQESARSLGDDPRSEGYCTDIMPSRWPGACSQRYPKARYFQVNLVALNRLGTIEFRGFPATTDPNRGLQWVLFLLKFVDRYKDDSRFLHEDVDVLGKAQLESSLGELEEELSSDLSFFRKRSWLVGEACQTQGDSGHADMAKALKMQEDWELGTNIPEEVRQLLETFEDLDED